MGAGLVPSRHPHRNQQFLCWALRTISAPRVRALAVAPGRAKAASMASTSAAPSARTGLPFLSTTDSMGRLRQRRGHRAPQRDAWSWMAGGGCCTMPGSSSGQPQASPGRTRVRTGGARRASSAPCAWHGAWGWPCSAYVRPSTFRRRFRALRPRVLRSLAPPNLGRDARRGPGGVARPVSRRGRGRTSPPASVLGMGQQPEAVEASTTGCPRPCTKIREGSPEAATSCHNTLSRRYFPRRGTRNAVQFQRLHPGFHDFHGGTFLICSDSVT